MAGLSFWEKNDDYDEDEGIYDDLNLDEEEEKFGRLITEDHDSDGSDDASEGVFPCIHVTCLSNPQTQQPIFILEMPRRNMTRKAWPVASGRRPVRY